MSRRHSLSVQLFLDVLRSLGAGVVVFALLFTAGSYLLSQTVYGESFARNLTERKFTRLQEVVWQEGVTVDNLRPLDIWRLGSKQIYLTIYADGRLIYDSGLGAGAKIYEEADQEAYDPDLEDPEREFSLILSDGTETRAFLYCYVGDAYYYWAAVLSGIAGFLVFSLCFIALVHRKLRYVQQLKAELDILAGGDLSYHVTVKGKDELGELAAGIDQMRQSIAAHQAAEERARSANTQLVTAMSHDLRTPLTSLLVYLELMERGKYTDEEQLSYFIRRCLEKALQIKSMADKLFEYFLVYSTSWEAPELETLDGDMLLRQLQEELTFSLESRGFAVEWTLEPLEGQIRVELGLLRRAFDNLYSNLLKYADPARPIFLSCRREGETARFTLRNGITPQRDKKESTNIGLHTCQRILSLHGGNFSYREEAGNFLAELTLPLLPK